MAKIKKISLSSSEIDDVIKSLESIQKELTDIDMTRIMNEAVEYCKSLTPVSSESGNHLVDRTYWEKTPTGYKLVQEGDYVAYVEFGTGIRGASSPHDEANTFNWKYNVGKTIHELSDGELGWFYKNNNGNWVPTHGQPANMQVYKTGLFLKEKLKSDIKYIVGGIIKNGKFSF